MSTKKKPLLLPTIGRVLQNRRLDLKMNLQEVSAKSGITYLTISKLEKGELKNISIETLEKIAAALGFKIVVQFNE